MNEQVHVVPKKGGIVFHPDTGQPIPKTGAMVRHSVQIARYLNRGDLLLASEMPPKKTHKKPASKPGKEE